MNQLKQMVMHNLGIKIASCILALSILAHVRSSEDREFEISVPVRLTGLPEELTYRGAVPSEVPVRVRARGLDEWRLRTHPPQIRIDLAEALPGLLQRPVTTEDVSLPGGSNAEVRSILEPVALALQIENVIEKTVPIRPNLVGSLPETSVQFGAVRVVPDSIWIRGPESIVSVQESILTEEVDLSGRNQSVEERIVLMAPEEVELEVETAELRVPIVPIERRSLGPIAVQLIPTLGREWTTRPDSVQVVLEGPLPLLRSVDKADVVVRADIRPPVRGEEESVALRLNLAERLKESVRAVTPEPDTVVLVRREH
ncbi:MAG: YbbR-like domain-containing protein [Candidatus Eisenbacteria bacterium]